MKLRFINAEALDKTLKASIHSNGRLGFSSEAAIKMGLSTEQSIGFSIDDDNPNERILYAEVYPNQQEGAFRVYKAGNYFYLSTKDLFDTLKYDYADGYFVFVISKEVIEGKTFYKFKHRVNNKIKKNEETQMG